MTASGEAMREPLAQVELERWYRRLLWAYPIGYRRAHGQEILTMLMDSAEPGRRVPARADVVDLVRGAVRQWFRLPVGLSPVVAAVLSAVVLGAVGAATGSWLAWQTAADLPSDTAALQITETAAGAPLTAPHVNRTDHVRATWRTVDVSNPNEQPFPNWTIEAAQARLRADGWTIGAGDEYTTPDYRKYQGGRPAEVHQRSLATRDGLVLLVAARTSVVPDSTGTKLATSVYPTAPSWEPGAILLGWLVGAVTGWLLTSWAAYRLRRRALPRRLAALALGLTALGLVAAPSIGLYKTLGELAFTDPGVWVIAPAYQWVVTNPATEHIGGALAIGLAILALAATGRHRHTARPTAAAA
ncbi:hypothetical protein ABZ671_28195 [Micromonospora sp. NPDC006766]|uniref:hypothetical protein n=1 Tax=Micromonospora sp. NPDC006766 TaxID=3154778 RepID=UPI0033E4880E